MRAVLIGEKCVDEVLVALMAPLFESFQVLTGAQESIPLIYMDPPDIILIDASILQNRGAKVVQEFRSNTIFGHLPIVALIGRDELESESWQDTTIDDYIVTDESELVMRSRLEFIAKRAVRDLDTNPLTRLPGNESIIRYIQTMIDQGSEIAVAWVDIDNFKPFNDCYGFSRGDEVLMATARIITNAVKEISQDNTLVGHIGGDDFVFICPKKCIRTLCEEIISRFDMVIRNFYNEEDLELGGIRSSSRDGSFRMFSVMTISIAVVLNEGGRYSHYGQASQDATDIKKYIKGLDGSNYMIDRRGIKR
ncbi:MAG: diguanylate cyclase [Syntrophaceae bacterium]|nr:diguanylate cyclase [Deltaproteobacteria bacterium]